MNNNVAGVDPPDPDVHRPAWLLPPDLLTASAARAERQFVGINPPPREPNDYRDRKSRYDFVLLVIVNMVGYFYATSRPHSSPRDAILTILALNTISWVVLHGNIGPLLKRVFNALGGSR